MATPTWAYGTMIKMGSVAGTVTTYTEIARVESISGGGFTQDFDEITAHDSEGRARQYMATLISPGEISFDILYDPTDTVHAALLTALLDGTEDSYQVVFPTATPVTWTLNAFVASFTVDAPVDAALRASISLRTTGIPTFS